MKFSRSLILLISILSSIELVSAEETAALFTAELDYSIVIKNENLGEEQLSELKSVSNIEFFYWIGSEDCYQVERGISEYLLGHPNLSIRRTPLVARVSWRPQAYLQPMLSQLASQLPESSDVPTLIQLYKQCMQDCDSFQSYEKSKKWFSQQIKEPELPLLDEESIWKTEKNFQKRANLFSITQVPTIIINERFKITAKQAQTTARLVEIIDYLITN